MVSVSKACGDVEALSALRDRLAAEIDATTSAQELAVLSRQFLAVIADLADLRPSAPSRVDEIAEKYQQKLKAVRGSDSSNTSGSRRKAQPR